MSIISFSGPVPNSCLKTKTNGETLRGLSSGTVFWRRSPLGKMTFSDIIDESCDGGKANQARILSNYSSLFVTLCHRPFSGFRSLALSILLIFGLTMLHLAHSGFTLLERHLMYSLFPSSDFATSDSPQAMNSE